MRDIPTRSYQGPGSQALFSHTALFQAPQTYAIIFSVLAPTSSLFVENCSLTRKLWSTVKSYKRRACGEMRQKGPGGPAEGTGGWRQDPKLTFRVILDAWAGPTEGLSWA